MRNKTLIDASKDAWMKYNFNPTHTHTREREKEKKINIWMNITLLLMNARQKK